jgi:hypothetical protein
MTRWKLFARLATKLADLEHARRAFRREYSHCAMQAAMLQAHFSQIPA